MDFDATLDELNITLGDTDNVTFTPEEKQRVLTKAWNDSYVVQAETDSTLTFSVGTNTYAIPDGMTTVTQVGISPSNSLTTDFVDPIGSDLWEVQESSLVFKNAANRTIPDTYTLYLKGKKKLDPESDSIENADLQEYVIALAGYNTLTLLGHKKANLFLKNDTTVAELVTLKRELGADVSYLRGKLATEFEGA